MNSKWGYLWLAGGCALGAACGSDLGAGPTPTDTTPPTTATTNGAGGEDTTSPPGGGFGGALVGGNGGDSEGGGGDPSTGGGSSTGGGGDGGFGGSGGEGGGGVVIDCVAPTYPGPSPTGVVNQTAGVTVRTLAGSGTLGTTDDTGANASFNNPVNLEREPGGLGFYVADFDNRLIRFVTPVGVVTTTFAGAADFRGPFGLARGAGSTLYVQTDFNRIGQNGPTNGSIWIVDTTTGAETIVAENIGRPRGLLFDATNSRLVLSDVRNHSIRTMDPSAIAPAPTDLAGVFMCPGYVDGGLAEARFYIPSGVARASNGDIIVADTGNNAIRRITATTVTTVAGGGAPGMVDGALATARFNAPRDVAIDTDGIIYVADRGNRRVRRIDLTAGTVDTIAGDGTPGFADGGGATARFFGMEGLAVAQDGGSTVLYVADGTSGEAGQPFHRIREISGF